MRTELKRLVEEELEWEPSIDAAGIGVEVSEEGVVTLTGHVRSYTERLAAEKAAKKVRGVVAVANDIEVRLLGKRDDTTIAETSAHALFVNVNVPDDRIQVVANDGWLTLEGEVDWEYQRRAAEKCVRELTGVRGVTNFIHVTPRIKPIEIREKIRAAFERNALVDADRVQVIIDDTRVILSGSVQSWQERTEAERQAWAAPGVTAVENKLRVEALIPAL
ncbi:MAG TPA: BON domain-containing protein [Longimicrobiales bacterium]|nr:BON domain-containing protein [Longimicrobiales bacterium]